MTVPPAADYLPPGSLIHDRYTVLREIGRGGFSVVYAARDETLGTEVALKLLVPPPAVARQARERMRREVRAVRGLAHRNIVQVHDFIETGPHALVVMELVDGPDLAVRVKQKGPLSVGEAAGIGSAIAGALGLAHEHGILHRDVKPQNILLGPGGRVCLTDFGSAKLQGVVSMTQTGGLPGTLDYMAPELLAGARADARADLYALGLSLFVAVTGQLPARPSPHLPPPSAPDGHHPRGVRAGVPEWLDAVIAKATRARPSDRFTSALQLLDVLKERDAAALPAAITAAAGRCATCGAEDAGPSGLCPACVMARRWVPLPRSLYAVAGGMVVMGAAAGTVVPVLFAVSPVVAAALILEAQRRVRWRSRLPAPARRRVARSLGELPRGAARRLLADVAQVSDAVYPVLQRGAAGIGPSEITAFLSHACGAAAELSDADETLATLEHVSAAEERPEAWADALATIEQRRDALVYRLLETTARLARAAHVAAGDGDAAMLEEMGKELEATVQGHAAAMKDVEGLLSPAPPPASGPTAA